MSTFPRGTLDPWYVTGFVEGQGTFTYSRSGRSMGLYFAIRLSETDRAVLDQIQGFFRGVGRIYRQTAGPRAAVYYRVTRTPHLPVIVDHFERYPLRAEKALSFEIWREMVSLKAEQLGRGVTPELLELAERLSAASPRRAGGRPE